MDYVPGTENATKHLLGNGEEVLRKFKKLIFSIKEEVEFEEARSALRGKVKKVDWFIRGFGFG